MSSTTSGVLPVCLILMVFAFVLFVIAGYLVGREPSPPHPFAMRLMCWAFALWAFAVIVAGVPGLKL